MDSDQLRCLLAGDPERVVAAVRAAANHGLVEAQTVLGQMLLDGRLLPRDTQSALRWFEAAAHGRHAEAMNMAGRCHELGWGTRVALDRAAHWYEQAAVKGYAWGQYNLANLLLHGLGITPDRRLALSWYLQAAAQGHAKAMNLVGRFHDEGWEVPADRQAAFEWYRRSAEAGDFRGQYNHATALLAQGQAVAAQRWFREAVRTGSPDFLAIVGHALARQDNPHLREIGQEAISRCSQMA